MTYFIHKASLLETKNRLAELFSFLDVLMIVESNLKHYLHIAEHSLGRELLYETLNSLSKEEMNKLRDDFHVSISSIKNAYDYASRCTSFLNHCENRFNDYIIHSLTFAPSEVQFLEPYCDIKTTNMIKETLVSINKLYDEGFKARKHIHNLRPFVVKIEYLLHILTNP